MNNAAHHRRCALGRGGHAPPSYYGWRIVAVLAITETVSWGILYYAFAVFLLPMQHELGFTRTTMTGAYSLAVLLTGLVGVPLGRWIDRHGARASMTTGSLAGAGLVAAWSQVHTVLGLYLVFAGIGVASAAVLTSRHRRLSSVGFMPTAPGRCWL